MVRSTKAPKIEPIAPPDAAEQRRAADHNRGDRVQRVGAADRRDCLAGIGYEGQEQPAERREEAGERVGGELCARRRHARHVGGGSAEPTA